MPVFFRSSANRSANQSPSQYSHNRRQLLTALLLTSVTLLSGCADKESNNADAAADAILQSKVDTEPRTVNPLAADSEAQKANATTDATGKLKIDWTQVDSGIAAVNKDSFDYPFTLDSEPVKSYMTFFKVDAQTARYNLTVGMASNEALSRVLDQLGNHYVSHELTDGEDIELVIHTTDQVVASRYDYVLTDPFAKGLVLPIVIQPDGKKPTTNEER